MDLRLATPEMQLREFVDRMLMRQNTAIPGIVKSFNATRQTVSAQPAIKMRTNIDGVEGYVEPPILVEVPIVYPRAGGYALTLPIAVGDSCLLLFSQRAIDNWLDRGGVQPPEEGAIGSRHHDLTDAIAVFGPFPTPQALTGWLTNGIELRNASRGTRVTIQGNVVTVQSGTSLITVNPDGSIEITAATGVTINGPLLVTGAIVSQTSLADPLGTMGEVRTVYNSHTHNEGGTVTATPNQGMS